MIDYMIGGKAPKGWGICHQIPTCLSAERADRVHTDR